MLLDPTLGWVQQLMNLLASGPHGCSCSVFWREKTLSQVLPGPASVYSGHIPVHGDASLVQVDRAIRLGPGYCLDVKAVNSFHDHPLPTGDNFEAASLPVERDLRNVPVVAFHAPMIGIQPFNLSSPPILDARLDGPEPVDYLRS